MTKREALLYLKEIEDFINSLPDVEEVEVKEPKGRVHDFTTKEGVIEAIKYECDQQGLPLATQKAYVIATVDHETNHTFKPVKEAYWLSEAWRKKNLRYYPYYGRGFIQLTWEVNYEKYSKILKYDFVKDPDHVMDPNISLFILVHGFKHGTFTGKKLEDYITTSRADFYGARRCVNGTDKASLIASKAKEYLDGLR